MLGRRASPVQAPTPGPVTLLNEYDGAVRPDRPGFTTLRQQVADQLRPGPPIQHPNLDDCELICFATRDGGIRSDRYLKVIYQHINDPVVWWSPDLILHKPQRLAAPPIPGISGSMRWIPVITFSQVTVDMAVSTGTPDGQDH